ncbi:MAG: hypothetical protein FJW38_29035 [Acidobacteria bacterium]|nr:hypothetical protein [Acidobacteriota bacterium]
MTLKDPIDTRPNQLTCRESGEITQSYGAFHREFEQYMTGVHQVRSTHRRTVERTEGDYYK